RLELLLNVVNRPYPSDDAQRREELRHRLDLIGQWWNHAPNAPNSDEPEGATIVLKAIYDGVYGPGLRRLRAATLADRPQVYGELRGSNLEPDRALLDLLYPSSGPLPLPAKVTARLTGTALQALSKRLKVAGRSQDFACRFLGCKDHPELKAAAPIAGLWAALAALGDASEFQAAVGALERYDAELFPAIGAWRTSLKRVADRSSALATVLVGREGQSLLAEPTPPVHLRDWTNVIRDARTRKNWFDKTGMLELWQDNVIRHDLNDNNLKLGNVLAPGGATEQALSRMAQAIIAYEDRQKEAISALVQELDTDDRQVALMALIDAKTRELNAVAASRERLSDSLAADDARYGDFLKTWQEAVKELDLDQWQVGPNSPTESFNAGAADAPRALSNNIADWAVGPKVEVEKGDFVALGVSGMWAPSCALRAHYEQVIRNINDHHDGPDVVVDYGDTGPEGYHFVSTVGGAVSFGRSHAESESYSSFYSDQFSSCGGFGINYYLNISASGCNQTSWAMQQSTTDTSHYENSESITQSAAFETGVRVPGTPSTLHAAGALLTFVMDRDITNPYHAIRVQTVQRSAGLQIEQPSDIYFVVNDRSNSSCPDSLNELTVQVHKARNLGALAQEVGERLADFIEELRDEGEQYAKKGVLLDSEISNLRAKGNRFLRGLVEGTPEFFRSLVSTVIEREITRIVRMVEIHNLGLRLEQLKADLIEQAKLLNSAADRKQLASLLSYLGLQGLDETKLMQTRSEVEDVFTTKVRTVAKLRGPRLLACAENGVMQGGNSSGVDDCVSLHRQLLLLATSDIGISQVKSAEALEAAAHGILAAGRVLDYEHDLQNTIVALRVPNPFLNLCSEGTASNACTYPIRTDAETAWVEATKLEAPGALAHAIWSQLLGTSDQKKTYFELLPEHLYSALSQHGALACASASPVVHSAAWVIAGAPGAHPIDDFCTTIDVWKDRVSLFQTSQGTEEYRIDSEINDSIPAKVPLLLSPWNSVAATYQANLQSSCGPTMHAQLTDSPFGAYRFALPPTARAAYGEDLRRAPEVYLVFSVSYLPILGTNPACRHAGE
ncbi:MAG: hypothetical protein MUF54_08970, partial [Polyangiaceae bacterium]|nr:hypothetical protein [Polyangiaceae bacterium]